MEFSKPYVVDKHVSLATAWLARYKNIVTSGSDDGPSSNWLGPGPFTTKSALDTAISNCLGSGGAPMATATVGTSIVARRCMNRFRTGTRV